MKYFFYILLFLLTGFAAHGQGQTKLEKGKVSFVSSRNVYVKFTSTKNIEIGDTLFVQQSGNLIPALIVSNKSSTSTVCDPLLSETMEKGQDIIAQTTVKEIPKKEEKKRQQPIPDTQKDDEAIANENTGPVITPEEDRDFLFKQKVNARVSAASYSNISDYGNSTRMRYAFNYRGSNLQNSRWSTDNYITFRHTLGEWAEVKEDLGRALKVYSLSVRYDLDSTSNVTFGRKINNKISSLGAIDGLQFEKGLGEDFFLGAITGSRPDFSNYGLNLDLLQFGAYAGFASRKPGSYRQTTFGFIEQRNKAQTDRRFVYFQHMGELMKDLNLFSSFEVDLFQRINGETENKLRLTNLYVSLRYRFSRKLRLSLAYDNRKNIIYYESYKTFIDQLIEDETRQGLRFGINYRPFKLMTWGVNTSWRFQKSDMNLSRNLNTYLNFSRIPVVKIRASVTANFLQTNYLDSKIFGIRLSRDIIKRKLDGDIYFRLVNYYYKSSDNEVQQKIAGASLSWRIMKTLAFYLYYEGTFDSRGQNFTRFNTRLIQRF